MKTKYSLSLLLGLAAFVPAHAEIDLSGLETELEDWSDDRPGAIVALVIDGDDSGFVSAGRWSDTDDRPADRDTHFELGSISKVFTALLAADVVGTAPMGWGETVAGGFASSGITYAQLATHTSGLPRLPADFPATGLTDPYAEVGLDQLRASFADWVEANPDAAKEAAMAYSNFGSAVLGQAVAAELGESYPEAVAERVLQKIGMRDTWYSSNEPVDAARLAPGHNSAGRASRWRFDAYGPAGAWVSTAADMERFMRRMMAVGRTVRHPAWVETMQPQAETPGGDRMGYGWFIREVGGHPVQWHAGGTGGYRSFVGVQRDTRRGIVVLGARDEDVTGIALGWFQGLFDAPADTATDAAAAEVNLNDFVGDYPLAPEFIISVFIEEGRLRAQATGQPSFGLRPDGTDRFAFEGVAARLSFDRDDSGKVTGLVLHQGGRDMPAAWNEAGSLRQKPQGVVLAPEQLDGLAGDYELAPSVLVSVTVSGSEVFVQLTGQPTFPVFASAEDKFFYEVVDAQITFQRDGDGNVTGLILHQAGRDMPAPKR